MAGQGLWLLQQKEAPLHFYSSPSSFAWLLAPLNSAHVIAPCPKIMPAEIAAEAAETLEHYHCAFAFQVTNDSGNRIFGGIDKHTWR